MILSQAISHPPEEVLFGNIRLEFICGAMRGRLNAGGKKSGSSSKKARREDRVIACVDEAAFYPTNWLVLGLLSQ
jgi:hypothetical protein